ncbi:MAG: ABC transporter ATP-binding protein [Gemmatimonadales bacterium]|jgi:ABC-2 type transport system ATP-binding protein
MPSTTPVIEVRQLTKHYGATVGVEDLSFAVEPGEVFGFLGPNGSGKTTTIRLLLDLIRPTNGTARLLGRPPADRAARRFVGYLPGELALDERLTGRQMLALLDALRPAEASGARPERRAELCERLGLTDRDLTRPIREYSRGTKQKVGLVSAFQHDPDLLILDEPTTGLDPLVREVVLELMVGAGEAGRTVFHSSHVLSEVDRTCTRVGVLRDGRLVAVERVDAMRNALVRKMVVTFAGPAPTSELELPGIRVLRSEGPLVELSVAGAPDALLEVLARHPVRHLVFPEPDLEHAFQRYYRPSGETHP